MDATREGHLEIAQMLRDAGASEMVLSGESAPHHQVSLCRATRYLQRARLSCLHFVMLACAGRNIRQHRRSKLRQCRRHVRAPQTQAVVY